MTKKEKLEYFKLVEPKLREKFLEKGEMLADSDFEVLNIKGKDIELFKEKYETLWNDEAFKLLMTDDEEFVNLMNEFGDLLISEDIGKFSTFEFPDDKYFFQLGVPKLDIKDLKVYLQWHTRVLYINKLTGKIKEEAFFENGTNSMKDNVQDYLRLVIDDPEVFLRQLINGEIDAILNSERKYPIEWNVPETHRLSEALDILNIENLVSILEDSRKWVLYIDWYMVKNERFDFKKFRSFDDFMEIKEFELDNIEKVEKEIIYEFIKNRFFFKVDDPSKMRNELLKGNMKILDEIKNITFSSIFLINENEA